MLVTLVGIVKPAGNVAPLNIFLSILVVPGASIGIGTILALSSGSPKLDFDHIYPACGLEYSSKT